MYFTNRYIFFSTHLVGLFFLFFTTSLNNSAETFKKYLCYRKEFLEMLYVEYEDQTNSTLFSSCSTEIIPLISDHRQIEVLRYIIDIHILRSQILHIFTFPLLNRPMFQMNKRPMFRMFRQCFLVPALPCFECYHYCLILFTDFFSGKR